MAGPERTPDDVRRDIARERQQLKLSIAELRQNVMTTLPRAAAGALAVVTALKLVRRRKRHD